MAWQEELLRTCTVHKLAWTERGSQRHSAVLAGTRGIPGLSIITALYPLFYLDVHLMMSLLLDEQEGSCEWQLDRRA